MQRSEGWDEMTAQRIALQMRRRGQDWERDGMTAQRITGEMNSLDVLRLLEDNDAEIDWKAEEEEEANDAFADLLTNIHHYWNG